MAKKFNPQGLNQNKEIARRGGDVAKITRDKLEKELGESVIISDNNINIRYINDKKKIDTK